MKLTEAIRDGLTNLGNSIENSKQKQIEWNRENLETGLLPDSEKLWVLKGKLFRDARAGKDTSELTKAINTLGNQIERDRTYDASFYCQLNRICSLWLLIGASAVVVSFVVTFLGCPNQSKFCADTANVSNAITKYFTGK